MAYVTNYGSNTVTPITIATNTSGTAITVGSGPIGIAISIDGTMAYVANHLDDTVTPITLATHTAGTAISLWTGSAPIGIAVSPDGCLQVVIKALQKCDLPADEVAAWCMKMIAGDCVGVVCDEELQGCATNLRHRGRNQPPQRGPGIINLSSPKATAHRRIAT